MLVCAGVCRVCVLRCVLLVFASGQVYMLGVAMQGW
jgi:hypothetical protein